MPRDPSQYPVRRLSLKDEGTDTGVEVLSPSERVHMVWQLTVQVVQPEIVFQLGVAPCRIDLLTGISGVAFDDAWARRIELDIEGMAIPCLARADLIANKRAAGRRKDLEDIALLEEDS